MSQRSISTPSRLASTASGLLILGMSFVGLASTTDVFARVAVAKSSARVRRVFVLSLHLCGTKAGVAGHSFKVAKAGGKDWRPSLIWRSPHVWRACFDR